MTKFTDNELEVLNALYNSEYGDLGDGVWSWNVYGNLKRKGSKIAKTSVGGIVGSLSKKGILTSEEYEKNENVILLTKLGREVMTELFEKKV